MYVSFMIIRLFCRHHMRDINTVALRDIFNACGDRVD